MSNGGYEKKDIPVKPVLIGGLLFVLTVVVTIVLFMNIMFVWSMLVFMNLN